jgi:hypothetical protein
MPNGQGRQNEEAPRGPAGGKGYSRQEEAATLQTL